MSSNPAVVIGVSAKDTASQVLDQVDKKVLETSKTIEDEGQKTITKSQQISDAFKANFTNIAQSVAGLGAGIVGFATSFDVLEKAQTRSDQANVAYQRSLERLKDLQASGKASSEQLAIAQQQVAINADKLAQAQDNVHDTYTSFLANVPSQFLSFGTGAASILNMLGVQTNLASIKTAAFSVINTVLGTTFGTAAASSVVYTGALTSMSAATTGATAATNAFRLASIMAFITNPVGIAIIGITTLIAMLVFNVGGLRDAFANLGKVIMQFLDDHFKPLADGIRWFLGLFGGLTDSLGKDMPNSTQKAIDATSQYSDTTVDSTSKITDFNEVLKNSQVELGTNTPAAILSSQTALTNLQGEASASADKFELLGTSAKDNSDLMAKAFAGNVASMVIENQKMQRELQETIEKFEELARAASRAHSGGSSGSSSSSYKGLTGIAAERARAIGFADGGLLNEPVLGFGTKTGQPYSFAEYGPEYFLGVGKGLPVARDRQESRVVNLEVTIPIKLDSEIIAKAVAPYTFELHADMSKQIMHGKMQTTLRFS